MCLSKGSWVVSSAEFFEGRIEGCGRSESAFEGDVGDFFVGGDEQSLGMADAQSHHIFPNRHAGVRAEEFHHVAGIEPDRVSDFIHGDIFKIARVDVVGDRFDFGFSAGSCGCGLLGNLLRHVQGQAMQACLDFQQQDFSARGIFAFEIFHPAPESDRFCHRGFLQQEIAREQALHEGIGYFPLHHPRQREGDPDSLAAGSG